VLVLVAAGIGGGLSGSIAGLASLISYPVLLALGLPPVTANVTNTVALVFSSSGSISASKPELRGQGPRLRRLAAAGLAGGVVGAALLLLAPAGSFEAVVPWLIGLASIAILARRRIETTDAQQHRAPRRLVVGTAVIGIYSGYFGAGAGVMLLALFLYVTGDPLPRANAAKNVVLGIANGVAAIGFALFGHVRWSFVAPLGAGLFIGGRLGPAVVRRVRTGPLRLVIALAGLGLAAKLAVDAYR
jgi:uncharacterized membrane protein YfcA